MNIAEKGDKRFAGTGPSPLPYIRERKNPMNEKCAILDCGGQYTKVIDRKVRELGVYTDIFPLGADKNKLREYGALILSGGPASVWNAGAPKYDPEIFDLGLPILGICYGMQLINEHFGGRVLPGVKTEYGQMPIEVDVTCPLFDGLSATENVLMSHGDAVKKLAAGFQTVAKTGDVVAGIYNSEKKIAGVQFHPEVDLTENGLAMLENFLRKICGFRETYALDDRIQNAVDMIQRRVGDDNVMVLVSGGVDSAVTAALLLKALPADHVYAIHVDHGLMRKDESDIICENLKELGLIHMLRVNAEDEFFHGKVDAGDGTLIGPLAETCDPEEKRRIIGSMFIKVTRDAAESLGLDFDTTFLAQGTLRPDLIESGNPDVSGLAHKIKTHHNDVDLVRQAREKGLIIETNWDWHKDEVRKVARMLGLREDVAARQPFPGPGLGVRILCTDRGIEVDPTQQRQLSEFMAARKLRVQAEIAEVQSVGVQGDNRSYKHLALLSGPCSDLEMDSLFSLARDIPNSFSFINRVAYVINKDTIASHPVCKPLHITREAAEILREADHIVTTYIMNPKISQCFAVLLPIGAGNKYSLAIRAVVTSDFMTARPAVPGKDFPADAFEQIIKNIDALLGDKIDLVLYDLTGKPPATVEWE